MKPIAAPIIGGMVTSTIHVLIITPVILYLMKTRACPLQEDKITLSSERPRECEADLSKMRDADKAETLVEDERPRIICVHTGYNHVLPKGSIPDTSVSDGSETIQCPSRGGVYRHGGLPTTSYGGSVLAVFDDANFPLQTDRGFARRARVEALITSRASAGSRSTHRTN